MCTAGGWAALYRTTATAGGSAIRRQGAQWVLFGLWPLSPVAAAAGILTEFLRPPGAIVAWYPPVREPCRRGL